MKNIQLIISYRGTNYSGWQIQPNGITIQEVLTSAIYELTDEKINLIGSGRTDARVHAFGQVANFKTESTIPPKVFYKAINSKLPQDIRIISSCDIGMDFHSRYSAKGKKYEYHINQVVVPSPFKTDLSFYVKYQLDWKAMEEASKYFIGEHDFKTFMASGSAVKDTVRTIEEIDFQRSMNDYIISCKGNGFLYNMVRIIVGTLFEVGSHRISQKEIPEIIAGLDRAKAGVTVPAHGLYLKEVFY
jgi:tRNA pseudouridine38-40 synthase